MNVLFTDVCNLNCPYCFAKGKIKEGKNAGEGHYITLPNLKKVIDFATRSKLNSLGVLGGEPTLHPQFSQAIDSILASGLKIVIFTNGLMEEENVQYLEKMDPKKVSVIANMNTPADYFPSTWKKLNLTLQRISKITQLGHTIYNTQFDGSGLIESVKNNNLKTSIRLGIAAPLSVEENKFPPIDDHRKIAKRIVSFADDCDKNHITLVFDCGFKTCNFSEIEIGHMFHQDIFFRAHCHPVIDVNIDLTIWRCFATSKMFNAPLSDFKDVSEARKYFNKKFSKITFGGARKECKECRHFFRKTCSGGCLGYVINTLKINGDVGCLLPESCTSQ